MKLRIPFFNRTHKPSVKPVTGSVIRSARVDPWHASVMRNVNRRAMRMYEAAVSNNLNADFPITISNADAEIFTSLMPTRSRARTLERDNPYAWAMLESMRVNVGGSEPFRLEMKAGKYSPDGNFIEDMDVNKAVQDAWREAGRPKHCTTHRDIGRLELDLQAITAMIRDGGVLGRHRRGLKGNKFGYAIQPLEIDRLDHYFNGKNPRTGNDIKLSVETDELGGVVSYWLLTRHPGAIFSSLNMRDRMREEVPADDMIALFDLRTRAEQTVGISRFASVIQRLHRVDQFDIAHVTAAIWSSCKPFFIVQDFPTAMDFVPDFVKSQMAQGDGAGEGEGDKVQTAEPGAGEILPWGQKPMLVDPKFPIEAASGFKKDQLRAAAAGSGTAYHMIANDLEGVNFSSGRLGENQFHDTCKILQEHFIESYRRPHFEEWLRSALSVQAIKVKGQPIPLVRYEELCAAAHFHGRRWPYVNPLQDAQADILRINAGLDSRDNVIQNSERGGDVESVNAEIASGNASDKAHGLVFNATSNAEFMAEESNEPEHAESLDNEGKPEKPTVDRPRVKFNGNGNHRNGHTTVTARA